MTKQEIKIEPDQEYLCPSDTRTYRITAVHKKKPETIVLECVDCLTKSGESVMPLEEFKRQLGWGTFTLKTEK